MNEPDDTLAGLLREAGPPPGPDADTLARLRAQALAEWRAGVAQRRRARARTWALAASVVLALAVVLPLSMRGPAGVETIAHVVPGSGGAGRTGAVVERGTRAARRLPADAIATGDTLAAPTRAVALRLDSDGPSVRIDAGTRLRWRGPQELELLAGRVYVDSGAAGGAATRGLQILVGDARVRHVGTQYVVARDADAARVAVREGRVRIDLPGDAAEIGRGEAAAFAAAGGSIRRGTAAITGAEWSWAEALAPPIVLEGRDLRGVLVDLARETGRPLRFATAEAERQARETLLHGPALDVSPAAALRTLLATSGFVATADSAAELVVDAR